MLSENQAKDNVIVEKDNLIVEKDNLIDEKDHLIDEKDNIIVNLTGDYLQLSEQTDLLIITEIMSDFEVNCPDEDSFYEFLQLVKNAKYSKVFNLGQYASINTNDSIIYCENGNKTETASNVSESRKSSVPNDFSRFRRFRLYEESEQLVVHLWRPCNETLKEVVISKLFQSETERFQAFLQEAVSIRSTLLYLFANKKIEEINLQFIFVMFWKALLGRFLPQFSVRSINSVLLSADMTVKGPDVPPFFKKQLTGHADVAFMVDNGVDIPIEVVNLLVVGELKRPNDSLQRYAYAQKDQLLIELEAVRQLTKDKAHGTVVKGFLTDLVVLNTAFVTYDEIPNIYVAPRVIDSEEYFTRMLFLLTELTNDEFKSIVVSTSTATPSRIDEHHSSSFPLSSERIAANISEKANVKKKISQDNEGKQTDNRNRKNKASKKHGYSQTSDDIIDFKLDEKIEHFERIYRGLARWEAALYGESFLSEVALEEHKKKSGHRTLLANL